MLTQPLQTGGQILARLVVDLELDHRQPPVIGGRVLRRVLEDQKAQAVTDALQLSGAETDTGSDQRAGLGRRRRGFAEVPDDSRSGGRHPLAPNTVVERREPFQQNSRRRSRHGHETMSGADASAAQRHRPDRPQAGVQGRDQMGRGNCIGDGVPSPDLMELDLLLGNPMHASLGRGEPRKDGDRMRRDFGVETAGCKMFANEPPGRVRVRFGMPRFSLIMMMAVTVMVIVDMFGIGLAVSVVYASHGKSLAEKHTIVVGPKGAADRWCSARDTI